ncbi:uncharacterized protein LOC116604125 [Nematostella vectensis]|uniref:uncharacterized protein LOC116604125 n=1 Tax=Nematostella vectensis TaxID=45351 RepID=UPI0020776CEB|nr:uncharacterized protein LOC116604125 [Nematostella vectensis]
MEIITRLLFLLLFVQGTEVIANRTVYVSRAHGHDTDSCGDNPSMPCKSLTRGFRRLPPGGTLALDGTDTEKDPYDCGSKKSLYINIGFTMVSSKSKACISCTGDGIHVNLTMSQNHSQVAMSQLVFKKTQLVFLNPNILIQECTLIDAAIHVWLAPSLTRSITLSGVVFADNSECLKVEVVGIPRVLSNLMLQLKNVLFQRNLKNKSTPALVEITGRTFLTSVWSNVSVMGNALPLFSCDVHVIHQICKAININGNIIRGFQEKSIFHVNASTANVTFSNIFSNGNDGFGFLTVASDNVMVEISDSNFTGHHSRTASGIVNIPTGRNIEVRLLSSNFTKSNGTVGGVLSISDGKNKNVKLRMRNISIFKCSGGGLGGSVVIGRKARTSKTNYIFFGVTNLDIDAMDVLASKNHGLPDDQQNCVFCLFGNRNLKVNLKGVRFVCNKGKIGPLSIRHLGGRQGDVEVNMTKTLFIDNRASKGMAFIKATDSSKINKFVVRIEHSESIGNKKSPIQTDAFEVYINHFTCTDTPLCFILKQNLKGARTIWHIKNSYFGRNKICISTFLGKQPRYIDILLKNITVYNNTISSGSPGLSINLGRASNAQLFTRANVSLQNVRFIDNQVHSGNSFLFGITVPARNGTVNITIRNTLFEKNYYLKSRMKSEVSSLLLFHMPDDPISMFDHKLTKGPCPRKRFVYKNVLNFEKVIFRRNTAYNSIIFLKNGFSSFNGCFFKDNNVQNPEGGSQIYQEEGTAGLQIANSEFLRTMKPPFPPRIKNENEAVPSTPFLRVQGNGPFEVFNSSFRSTFLETLSTGTFISKTGFVHIDNDTMFSCPVGSYAKLTDTSHTIFSDSGKCSINITKLIYECKSCPKAHYSLQSGLYFGTQKKKFIPCLPCPFGASCSYNIKSEHDFWGYVVCNKTDGLNFTNCPEKYCTVPRTVSNASVYNSCYGNRTGLLCGACAEGFTESLFCTHCRRRESCNDAWFWVVAVFYSALLAAYILYKPQFVSYMIHKSFWFKGEVPNSRVSQMHEHGYTKIVFYFYQVADVIMLQPYAEILARTKLVILIVSLFNFKVKVVDVNFGCPFPGLTAVTKELFWSLSVFLTMSFLPMLYGVECLYCRIKKRPKPFLAAYLAAVVEILLLGYERLGETSLKLLSCVPLVVHGEKQLRLFHDAHIRCWNWWQYLLMAYNLTFMIPFIFVLFFGSVKLHRRQISPNWFIAACCFPLPVIVVWLILYLRRKQRSTSEYNESFRGRETRSALMEVLGEAFREPAGPNKGAIYWESVLTARRFVFLCLAAFITSPAHRLLIITIICVINLVHTLIVTPYKKRGANYLAVALLFVHVVLAVANLGRAVLISAGARARGPIKDLMEYLEVLQVFLLSVLPALLLLLAVLMVLSQIMRLMLIVLKIGINTWKARKCTCRNPEQEESNYESLIYPFERSHLN